MQKLLHGIGALAVIAVSAIVTDRAGSGIGENTDSIGRTQIREHPDVPAPSRREHEVTSPLVAGPIPVRATVSDEVMRPDHLFVLPEREQSQRTCAGRAPSDLHLSPGGDRDSIEHERPELSVLGDPPYLDQSVRGSTGRTSRVTMRARGEADER